mmetsp:Transcript_100811/g.289743  ORF Transcript_100811/g.289743 Transcript_100811/m.289743 type:complete len:288 (+) Transcript_100811:141-1004(+)
MKHGPWKPCHAKASGDKCPQKLYDAPASRTTTIFSSISSLHCSSISTPSVRSFTLTMASPGRIALMCAALPSKHCLFQASIAPCGSTCRTTKCMLLLSSGARSMPRPWLSARRSVKAKETPPSKCRGCDPCGQGNEPAANGDAGVATCCGKKGVVVPKAGCSAPKWSKLSGVAEPAEEGQPRAESSLGVCSGVLAMSVLPSVDMGNSSWQSPIGRRLCSTGVDVGENAAHAPGLSSDAVACEAGSPSGVPPVEEARQVAAPMGPSESVCQRRSARRRCRSEDSASSK